MNGKIPGGCIARLGDMVKEFVRGNLADKAGEPYAKRMQPLEIAAFVADREPDALESLAMRLAARSNLTPFSGSLQSGVTKFRVLPVDPNAKKPGASSPAKEAPK